MAAALIPLLATLALGVDPTAIDPPGPWQHPPELPVSKGRTVVVRTVSQLQEAVQNLRSHTTVWIMPGHYPLTQTLNIRGGVSHVTLCGKGNDRNSVVITGRGMSNKDFGNVPHGIMVSDATDVTIANLSVGKVWFHAVTYQGQQGCKRVRLVNARLFDAGEQLLKVNPNSKGGGADDCVVEHCVFEYTDTARHWYTQGMSVHGAANWVVRNNLFRNIRGPKKDPAVGGCIDFWNGCRNTTVEGNVMANCRVGIRLGFQNLTQKKGQPDHEGGIVRNNLFWRQPGAVFEPDVAIHVADSPGTQVLHNTVIMNGTYTAGGAIEYRWAKGVVVAHNLSDGRVWKRENAQGEEIDNVLVKDLGLFKDAAGGDLHLSESGRAQVRKVRRLENCPLDLDGNKRDDPTPVGAVGP